MSDESILFEYKNIKLVNKNYYNYNNDEII